MKMNLKVRFNNPVFWAQIAIAILVPMLTAVGLEWSDMTTWAALGDVIWRAIQNPVTVFAVIASVYNAMIDPTTRGLGDSERALTYTKPNK